MNPDLLIGRLAVFAPSLRHLLGGISNQDSRWRPPDGGWSVLEILGHLIDEDVDDFRSRMQSVLEDPERNWKVIDPRSAAEEKGYNEGEVGRVLQRFEMERARSVAWLKGLVSPAWGNTYNHPKLGAIKAGDLLASWSAHDAMHLRQFSQRLYQLAVRDAPGFSVAYAGPWNKE
ncbi:MAG: hypothetical protein ACI8QC_000335 [Planctomycetota bacterium]|jgi:hypothetical protein